MTDTQIHDTALQVALTDQTKHYLNTMQDQAVTGLYDMVLEQVEAPLFDAVMQHAKYNQSKAATILGVSRGTLRTKLKYYFDDKYCGSREEKID